MRTTSVLRVGAVLGVLMLCGLLAAERRSPLLGATREQVRAKLGEPKSNIVAGPREVLIYPQERVVLRNGVVVEVDALYEFSSSKAPAEEAAGTRVPGAAGETADGAPPAGNAETADAPAEPGTAAPVTAAEPEVTIKSVRPPSRNAGAVRTPAPVVSTPIPPPATREESLPAAGTPGTSLPDSAPAPALNTPPATVPAPVVTSVPVPPPALEVSPDVDEKSGARTEPANAAAAAAPSAANAAETSVAPAAMDPVDSPIAAEAPVTSRTPYLLGGLAVALVALLAWAFRRRRQRSLLLEATAVSHPPFATAPLAHAPTSRFTLDLLQKLEWKRFEELVCAYYNKTGVLAVRTKAGRQNPVHVRISWKGEQRPFACVHCIAYAPMAVDPRPIEALHAALATEDVRRGYVVTSGKFASAARDVAEEKQITLLPGDVFIEKLNALPDAARAELLKDVMAGDYATPSCPTCESKMGKSAADPLVWECAQCGTTMR